MPKKSCKVMMMKPVKLGWAGAGKEPGWSRSRAWKGQKQGRSRNRVEAGRQEQSRSRGRSRSWAGG